MNRLTRAIDLFYPPFQRFMPLQVFRYLACGAINWATTSITFWVVYNFVLAKRNLHLGEFVVAAHTAALGVCIPLSFALGFWMQRSISFRNSTLGGRTQLFRYLIAGIVNTLITWGLEKLLVEVWGVYPTPAFMAIYLTTAALGFVVQKYFTFRGA